MFGWRLTVLFSSWRELWSYQRQEVLVDIVVLVFFMQGWGKQCQKSQNRRVSYNASPSDVITKGNENFSRKFNLVYAFWNWKTLTSVKGNGCRNTLQRNVIVIKVNSKGSLCRKSRSVFVAMSNKLSVFMMNFLAWTPPIPSPPIASSKHSPHLFSVSPYWTSAFSTRHSFRNLRHQHVRAKRLNEIPHLKVIETS